MTLTSRLQSTRLALRRPARRALAVGAPVARKYPWPPQRAQRAPQAGSLQGFLLTLARPRLKLLPVLSTLLACRGGLLER